MELEVGTTVVWECPTHRFALHRTTIQPDFQGRPRTFFFCRALQSAMAKPAGATGCSWLWSDLVFFAQPGRHCRPIILRKAAEGEALNYLDGNWRRPREATEPATGTGIGSGSRRTPGSRGGRRSGLPHLG